jgi:hypothetical protein
MSKTSLYSQGVIAQVSTFATVLSVLQNRNVNADLVAIPRDLTVGEGFGADTSLCFRPYAGGVYSPAQNRVYLIPYGPGPGGGDTTHWHYFNCQTNQLVAYVPVSDVSVAKACYGGAYSPVQNRIYFAPYGESNATNWHYIDCNNDISVTYSNGTGVTPVQYGYQGAVYSAVLNRIYFIPYNQIDPTAGWHYVNCANGSLTSYTQVGVPSLHLNAYSGGIYYNGCVYFVPAAQGGYSTWHYIDNVGTIQSYPAAALGGWFSGGVLDPVTGRIYLTPNATGVSQTNLYYLDVTRNPPVLNSYTNELNGICHGTNGGIYSPLQNEIIFVPGGTSLYADQYFYTLNLTNLNILSYPNPQYHNSFGIGAYTDAYIGGVYSVTNNMGYFIPNAICTVTLNPILRVKIESADIISRQYFIGNPLNS